jgi:DNA-binding response OmpR family regulator
LSPTPDDKLRVLFAEDELDHAFLVQAFFAGMPEFALTHAQDGDQTLRLLAEQEWALLVTDLNLPGADGFEIIRTAKEKNRHLPVLATTGYAQEHYWDQAFRSGADQVMVKPLDRDDFVARVRSMVSVEPEHRQANPDPEAEPEPRQTTAEGGSEQTSASSSERETVLVVEGLLGDGIMGCAGASAAAAKAGAHVVILPLPTDRPEVDPSEYAAAQLAAQRLGFNLRLAEPLVGDPEAMTLMLDRAVGELRPSVLYAPAQGDRHPSRAAASRIATEAARGRVPVLGYQTATSPSAFAPKKVLDVTAHLHEKVEALGEFVETVETRPDLEPELARAYAHYWGRLRDFGQAEAFEILQEKTE